MARTGRNVAGPEQLRLVDLRVVFCLAALVRRVVANWTGIFQYTIDQVLEDMIARCRELKLRLAVPEDVARQEFTVLLTVQAMNYLHSGGHRLFL